MSMEMKSSVYFTVSTPTQISVEGQWDGGQGVKGLMNLHYSEENKQRVMRVKSKYDPGNLFRNHMSVPTLDCYNNGNCS